MKIFSAVSEIVEGKVVIVTPDGKIIDRGLVGVQVSIKKPDGTIVIQRKTNEDGYYHLEVPPGEYILEIKVPDGKTIIFNPK